MSGAPDPVDAAVGSFLTTLPPSTRPVVACSGGADSLALAVALRSATDRSVGAVVVDHGLQPGSAQVARQVAAQLRALRLDPVEIRTVHVDGAGEAAARDARYRALRPKDPNVAVLLGHTLDDQAETVLLGLARGSGPRSIAGMTAWRAPWGRPLLGVRRTDTQARCRAAVLSWWDDPHNTDDRFTRVRLRTEVLPLLEQVLGGGVAPALARTAALLADDLSALDQLAADLWEKARSEIGVAVAVFSSAPAALRRRVIRLFLIDAGIRDLTSGHLVRVDQLVITGASTAAVRLPGGLDAFVTGAALTVGRLGST